MTNSSVLAILLVFVLFASYYYKSKSVRRPPGPAGWPLIGNVFDNPPVQKHRAFMEWGRKYGPVVRYRLLTEDIIILNNRDVAYELLEKKSSNSQDRPRQIMCGELMSWSRGIALAPAGARHRMYRKLVNGVLSPNATKTLWPVQERAARSFVSDLLRECSSAAVDESGDEYRCLNLLRRSVGMNVAGIIFGAELAAEGVSGQGMTERDVEKYIHDADVAHALFGRALVPFAYMVDWVPWLKHVPEFFPFAGFKKEARLAREGLERLTMDPFNKTLERIKSGNSQSCYVDFCLRDNPNPSREDLESIAWTSMSAYTGGSDTTIGMVTTFFLAASLHPEAQRLAQQELDEIVGPDRMPSLEDRVRLPYVSAFVQECLRSAPAVPVGVAHRALKDDVIDGYFISKGSTLVANIWGILHDESVYASPFTFDPARFLPETGTPVNPNIRGRSEPEIGALPFGYGRRICPGMHLADSGVWIYAASVLWAFNVQLKDPVEDYEAAWRQAEFSDGALLYPLPFKVKLSPRFSDISVLCDKV